MKSLSDCPVEIMHSILECLPAASLRNICLVSRALHDVAEPLLYADLVLIWLGGDRPPSFVLLLQNFRQRPHLAKYVQRLNFTEGYTRDGWRISVDSSELASLIEIVEDINPPFRDLWIQELENGTPDAFIMLFLSLVPNITYLHLSGKFCDDNRLLGRMLRASLCQTVDCNLPRFQHLQKVYMNIQDEAPIRHPGMQNTADVLSLFYLPAARSISAVIDNPAVFTWPADAPNPSLLTSLHIRGVREGNLGHILATTKNLKTLEWQWRYMPVLRNETNTEIINLDQIAKDLSFVKDTLEDLRLLGAVSSDPELDDDLPWLQFQGSLKPLRRFEKLQKLLIPQQFLTGFSPPDDHLGSLEDMMPKNIHHLTITDDMSWLEQSVMSNGNLFMLFADWWRNLQIHTPYFNSLKLETMQIEEAWCAGREYDLDGMCDHFGIQVEYSYYDEPDPYDSDDM
ncbi:hypothetical protein HDV63DRAFT_384577 [Trichoderma sp. SZMC 28014]